MKEELNIKTPEGKMKRIEKEQIVEFNLLVDNFNLAYANEDITEMCRLEEQMHKKLTSIMNKA
jgi:hypothetical protein